MTRTLSHPRIRALLAVLIGAAVFAPPAAAQLQTINVDCAAGGTVQGALAAITDRDGPNQINVSGICNGGFNVNGFNRLTIQGGATISLTGNQNIFLSDSHSINLTNLLVNGGAGVTLAASRATFTNVTVRNNNTNGN